MFFLYTCGHVTSDTEYPWLKDVPFQNLIRKSAVSGGVVLFIIFVAPAKQSTT